MQLFKLLVAVILAITSNVFAQDNSFATGLLQALRQNNLTQLANIVEQNAATLVPALEQIQGNKTILAPTDQAFQQLGQNAPTGQELIHTIAYHVLTNRFEIDDIPRDGYEHEIAPTLLNSTNAPNRKQVVVLSRGNNNTNGDDDDDGRPIIIQLENNVTFANNSDGPSYQSILVQPINTVLSVPGNLSQAITALAGANQINQLLQSANLISTLESLSAVTIFAPNNEAIQSANEQIQAASQTDQVNVLRNHVLNGTVAYSTNLPADDDDDDNTNTTIRQAITSSGQQISFSNRDDGLFVTSGNITARIIRSDILLGNGVIHIIDQVLLNTQSNQQAADQAASSASASAATNTAPPGRGGSSGAGDGAQTIIISMSILASTAIASGIFLLA